MSLAPNEVSVLHVVKGCGARTVLGEGLSGDAMMSSHISRKISLCIPKIDFPGNGVEFEVWQRF